MREYTGLSFRNVLQKAMQIHSILNIEKGITSITGSGGKTTLMYTLARELVTRGTVIICTSTHIIIPDRYELVTGGEKELKEALDKYGAACVGTLAENGKITASSIPFEDLGKMADYVLVEADGAGGLPLKAHAPYEPVIPALSGSVIQVVGADGLGGIVREVCHRPDIWAGLAGTDTGSVVTPEGEARVIIAEDLPDLVYINKTDSAGKTDDVKKLADMLPYPTFMGSLKKRVVEKCH